MYELFSTLILTYKLLEIVSCQRIRSQFVLRDPTYTAPVVQVVRGQTRATEPTSSSSRANRCGRSEWQGFVAEFVGRGVRNFDRVRSQRGISAWRKRRRRRRKNVPVAARFSARNFAASALSAPRSQHRAAASNAHAERRLFGAPFFPVFFALPSCAASGLRSAETRRWWRSARKIYAAVRRRAPPVKYSCG